jgi:arsenite methyltransferase
VTAVANRRAIEAAGFELHDLKENNEYRFVSQRADNAAKKYGVKSVSLLATKREHARLV